MQWLPVTDAERALKTPAVEKDAGAEILLWRVHVSDDIVRQDLQRVFYHYIRLKIFDEKGKEKASTIDLPYREPGGILNVSGRTVKPDGSILDLDRKSIYKRDLVRAGGRKEKVVSFAMPGVEPGAIIEYRWTQTEDDNRFRYLRLHFQRDFPVQRVTYFFRPLSREYIADEQLFLMPLNANPTPIQQGMDGYSFTTVENVPAAHDEPYSPSDASIEPWALLLYRKGAIKDPEKFWMDEGRKAYKEFKDSLKISDEMKRADFVEAASSAKTDDEKLAALAAGLRKNVRSVFDPDVTTAQREEFFKKLPKDRSRNSAEIIKSGLATSGEMNVAFAAVASVAGIDARLALISSRAEVAFNPKAMPDRYFLDDSVIAVRNGDKWKLLDVNERELETGILHWVNEGVFALVTDPKTPTFIQTPAAAPEASLEKRVAQIRLFPDGSIEGNVEETMAGHSAEGSRAAAKKQSAAQREEALHDRLTKLFPDAEVTAIKIENLDNPDKPVTVHYHLKAPQYAQVTGKRLLFQPVPFERAAVSRFSASDRKLPIEFPFAWKESDEIHFLLPAGFELDNAQNPGSLDFGDPGSYKLELAVTKGAQPELIVKREFTFGNKGMLFFPLKAYPTLKKVFDEVQVRDSHTLSLIQTAGATPVAQN